ncbi:MAG: phosphoribosyltransferase [Candidatus Omnitrophica bacterium]|nr:phosphoribosyltransferase [Candidatus Omnitrophota bacterium]
MFRDRKDAGIKLAARLKKYKNKGVVVLAVPRGGIEVGCEVAKALKAPFSAVVVRKLPFPNDPEAGFGAIAENGSVVILEGPSSWLPKEVIETVKRQQAEEVKRRIKVLRGGLPLPEIKGKTVILVDDGLAMGSTMLAAVKYCRAKKAGRIIAAVPISGGEAARLVGDAADELVVLEKPSYFYAVAQGYEKWYDLPDAEAADILKGCYNLP